MRCKSWVSFPLIRKSSTYDTSQSLDKHRELGGLSHQASFRASQPCRRTGLNASVGHHQAHLLSANRYMICSVVSVLLFFNDDLAVSIGFLFLGFSIGVLFAHTNRMRFRNPSDYFFDFILALFVMFWMGEVMAVVPEIVYRGVQKGRELVIAPKGGCCRAFTRLTLVASPL